MIYFATVLLNKEVHAQALGFTRWIYPYVQAGNEEQAEQVVQQGIANLNDKFDDTLKVEKISFSVAKHQDKGSYTFPEQIWPKAEHLKKVSG